MSDAMRVLVFASQKGGAGKTTLSGHIAVQAELAGAGPVALIDTDPQGSLATWWNARESGTPAFVQAEFTNLFHAIEQLRDTGFKLIVIDTPPAVTRAIAEVVSYADLVILPTRPSPHDLRAVGATVDIIEARRKQMIFVVNAATPRARITSEAAVALSQHGTVAPVTLHQRIDYAASMIDGRTVMETDPQGKSSKEVIALWEYLETRLAKVMREQSIASQPVASAMEPQRTFGQRPMSQDEPSQTDVSGLTPENSDPFPTYEREEDTNFGTDQQSAPPARPIQSSPHGRPAPTFGRRILN